MIAAETPVAGLLSVVINDERVPCGVIKYLLSLGHRHVAIVSGRPTYVAVQRRTTGFMCALSESGLTPTTDMIVPKLNSFTYGVDAGNSRYREKIGPLLT